MGVVRIVERLDEAIPVSCEEEATYSPKASAKEQSGVPHFGTK
jgi:hypothetical protein